MKGMIRIASVLSLTLALVGCATTDNPKDPFEGYNRAMFSFNDKLDKYALKPTASAYQTVVPSFIQTGVGNFFGNLGDVWTAVNNLLQGKGADGMSDVARVLINSTLGLGGLIDIGTEVGLQKHKEDFGQTLGKWGVKPGPYIVLPLLGASTLRDTVALPLDFQGDVWLYTYPVSTRNTGSVIRVIDKRATLLDAGNLIEDAALDPYQFVRDAYLQRRESQVHDGEAPKDNDEKPQDKPADDKPADDANNKANDKANDKAK
jgi:phospholipid-binding lipoprotein MlaA